MTNVRLTSRNFLPVLRHAGWRRCLLAVALVCMVGIFSVGVTHHHKTLAAELACPVCHVTAHGAPDLLHVDVTPSASFAGWYRHPLLTLRTSHVLPSFGLRPPARAPPVPATSLV
ncbi:MAG: hypothetical protein ACRETQ_08390 [Gammaproteobacteria bacterium]